MNAEGERQCQHEKHRTKAVFVLGCVRPWFIFGELSQPFIDELPQFGRHRHVGTPEFAEHMAAAL
jgi:hypothetical protein